MASVDIVIPCYNYGRFLPRSVESVLSQNVRDLRIIIIDNASTDDSVDVAQRLMRMDSRIALVRHAVNLGPHASFNEGIDLAGADYFMILCADDLLADGVLSRAIDILEVCPQAAFLLGAEGRPIIGDQEPGKQRHPSGWRLTSGHRFIERCCRTYAQDLAAYAILARTRVQKEVGHYRASLTHLDDVELALRLACEGAVVEIESPLVIKRLHADNLSEGMWQDRKFDLQERERAFESFFAREGASLPGSARLHALSKRRIGEAAYWSAASHFVRGHAGQGRALLHYAFALNPLSMLIPPIGHLYRTKGAFRRVSSVVASRLGGGA